MAATTTTTTTTITGGAQFAYVDNVTANDFGTPAGESIFVGDDNVVPNGLAGTTGIATTTNSVTGANQTFNVPFYGEPNPNEFKTYIPYDSALTGAYTLTFTNPAAAAPLVETTPTVGNTTPPPFAQDVLVTGSGTTPTVSWTYPSGSIDEVDFEIFDDNTLNGAGQPEEVFNQNVAGTSGSVTVPAGLLNTTDKYTFRILGTVLRDPTGAQDNANTLALSATYLDFTALPASVPAVSLPYVDPVTGAYDYSISSVQPGQIYYIDPAVAIGYTYKTGAGDPNFASVLLPSIQTGDYTVSYTANGKTVSASVAPGVAYTFPPGGVSAFTVTGVDPSLALNPASTTSFITGLTFTGAGSFTGTQTPLLPPTLAAEAKPGPRGTDVVGAITPTQSTDTYSVTATAAHGKVTVSSDQILYTPSGPAFCNVFGTDDFTYTATDESGFSVNGTAIIGGDGFHTVSGASAGNTSVILGGGFNTVTVSGTDNAVSVGDGVNNVSGGAGDTTVTAGIGINAITLAGNGNTVTTGWGLSTIATAGGGSTIKTGDGASNITLGAAASTVSLGAGQSSVSGGTGDMITLAGRGTKLTLAGTNETVALGAGQDEVHYNGQFLTLDLPTAAQAVAQLGANTVSQTGTTAGSVIDVLNVPTGVAAASDGHGGTLLKLGHGASVDVSGFATILVNGTPV